MPNYFNQPILGNCCDPPCDRGGPCDPCGDCPETICCDDDRSWGAIDFSGTYNENGTYGGSIAYKREDSGAWFWRNWDDDPTNGWWTISLAKGSHATDYVTQSENPAGGGACPISQTEGPYSWMWASPLDGGSVVPGACAGPCKISSATSVSIDIRIWFTRWSKSQAKSWLADGTYQQSGMPSGFDVLEPSPGDWGYNYAIPYYSASGVIFGPRNLQGEVWNFGSEVGPHSFKGTEMKHAAFGVAMTKVIDGAGPGLRWISDSYRISGGGKSLGYTDECTDPVTGAGAGDFGYFWFTTKIG